MDATVAISLITGGVTIATSFIAAWFARDSRRAAVAANEKVTKVDEKVDKVALQTDGLTTKVVEFAKAAGIAEGTATEGAAGAERAAILSASREGQATVDEVARAAVTAEKAATDQSAAEARNPVDIS